MHRHRLLATAVICAMAVLFAPSLTADDGEPSVSGTLTANGAEVRLPYVYVWAEDEGFYDPADPTWTLLFVEHPVEQRDLDGTVWDAAYVRLGVTRTAEFGDEPELRVYSQEIRLSADTPGNLSGGTYPTLELSSADPERFEGRVYHAETQEFFDDTYRYDLTFSAPMSDPDAPIGDPLPAGGGEPGEAYLAWCDAVRSGDIERMKELVPVEQAEMMEGEEVAEQIEFMQMMTPDDIEIVSGSSDGDTAILEVTGTMDGQPVSGEITMTRMGDLWVATGTMWE